MNLSILEANERLVNDNIQYLNMTMIGADDAAKRKGMNELANLERTKDEIKINESSVQNATIATAAVVGSCENKAKEDVEEAQKTENSVTNESGAPTSTPTPTNTVPESRSVQNVTDASANTGTEQINTNNLNSEVEVSGGASNIAT